MSRQFPNSRTRSSRAPYSLPEGSFGQRAESREVIKQEEGESLRDFFKRLWYHYQGMIVRFVWFRVRNTWEAQDILSQTYLKAYQALQQGTVVENVRPWLCRIADNLVNDHFRRYYDKRLGKMRSFEDMIEEPYNGITIQLTLGRFLDIIIVRRALHLLKLYHEPWFYITNKIYFEGYKFKEVAAELNITEGAAKALQHRALVQLREFIGELSLEQQMDPVLDTA